MFTNRSTNEINVRVVFYGLPFVGKTTLLQRIYDATPEDQKGKMFSVQSGTERTLFFDLLRSEMPGVRLHLYALSGEVTYAVSSKLILKNVDAVVFVADAQKERHEANIASLDELRRNLSEQNLMLERLPHVVCVTKGDLDDASIVFPDLAAVAVDGRTGEGTVELMSRLIDELRKAIAENRLREWEPSAEETRSNREFSARARLVGHYSSTSAKRNPSTTRRGSRTDGRGSSSSSTSPGRGDRTGPMPRQDSASTNRRPTDPSRGSSSSHIHPRRAGPWSTS